MSPQTRWHLLDSLFSEAVGMDAHSRAGFLDEHCGSDPELRKDLESLLRSADEAGEFLDRPILDAVKAVVDEPDPTLAPATRIAQ